MNVFSECFCSLLTQGERSVVEKNVERPECPEGLGYRS